MTRPPRLARWLLLRMLPPEVRSQACGDLDEEFRRHIRPARSAARAAWWYWRQVITSIPPAVRLARRRPVAQPAGRRPLFRRVWADAAQDLRYGARLLRRQPGFTVTAAVTLAVGIGANTAIVSLVQAVLFRPLPYREPGRLVHLFEFDPQSSTRREASFPEYLDWHRLNRTLEDLAGYNGGSVTLSGGGVSDRVAVAQVTGNFFHVLGVDAWLGRTITAGEDGRPAARVVVLTYGAWQRRFGGDPAILGQSIRMNDVDTTVVGVLPASFEFPLRGGAELYVPLETSKPQEERRYWHWLDLIGRLKPGVTREQAEDDLSALARAAASQAGDWHAAVVEHVVPLRGEMVRGVRPALLVLAAAATVVLLVACANVAALLLVRSATRRRELSIRAAVGADRGRLVRQQLTEAVLLALVGGGGGVLVGRWGLSGLLAAMPLRQRLALPHLRDLAPDTSMLLVALAATLATALLVGLPAAWRAARGDVHGDLKAGGRGSTGSGLGSLTPVLVATETALAVVLLTGAALLVQSFVRLLDVSPGFDPNGLLTMRLALPGDRYRDADALRDFHQRFLDQVRALPGVRDASSIDQLPLTGRGNTGVPTVEGMTLASGEEMPEVNIRTVDAAYFRAMGVPLVRGRGFTSRDAGDAPKVVLVNQTFVDRFFPNGEALGRRLVFSFFEGQPRWEVVGIVGDERFGDLDEPMTPVVYFPYDETPDRAFSLVVRTATDPAALAASIRRETVRLDPGLPVYSVLTMARIVADSSAVFLRRYVLLLVGAFALVALLLSAVGLYGVLARTVAERTQEIGVRLALGAGPGDVVRAVAGRGLAPATAGLLAGLAAALASTRLLGGLLFEIRSNDPGTLVGVALLLFLVASVACWIPARRAARVDPVTALRAE